MSRPPVRPARRFLRALSALLVAATLVACSNTVAGTALVADGGSASAGRPDVEGGITSPGVPTAPERPAPVPAGLEVFYSQGLDWTSCATLARSEELRFYRSASLQCADLTVPLAYDNPTGPTITLKVLRKPATDQGHRIGSVITNPGGPGASGVENAGVIGAYGLAADLNKRFDLVGFDPRGVGASEPAIRCKTDEERDVSRAQSLRTRTQEEVDAANTASEQLAKGCAALTGAEQGIDGATFLANVGTRDVARDLDVLRAVLGDQGLTYIGWSYGTSIGTVYAEQFPENVRAMILDGALDPAEDSAARDIGQGEGFQQAFEDFAAWCADQEACVFGDDPTGATQAYQSLVRPLLDAPVKLTDGRVLSFDDAITGTIQALYGDDYWEALSSALLNLSKGDGNALMSLADVYEGRDAQGAYSNSLDAFPAIQCIDGARNVDPVRADEIAAKFDAAAPFQDSGDPPRGIKDSCAFWPAAPTLTPHVPDVTGLPRILVISTTGDPATPYQAGVNLADVLDSSLLTVEGTNHTAYLSGGIRCVDEIGTRYLITLELPVDDTTCR